MVATLIMKLYILKMAFSQPQLARLPKAIKIKTYFTRKQDNNKYNIFHKG